MSSAPAASPRGDAGGRAGGPLGSETGSLGREISDVLVGFAMAMHRFAIYPSGHPSLLPVAERMLVQLSSLLGPRPALVVGITTRQLMVDGAATPEDHPVLSDLARRLHAHQLGAVILRRGVELDSLMGALDVLSRDPVRGERPLGLLPARDRPSWPRLQLLPLEYEALELDEGARGRSEPLPVRELWKALFRSVMDREADSEDPETDAAAPVASGSDMARQVGAWMAEGPGREGALFGTLGELIRSLQWHGETEDSDLRGRTSEFLLALDFPVLSRMVHEGGTPESRRRLVVHAARAGLTSEALLVLVRAVLQAGAGDLPEPLSAPMDGLLRKLALRGEGRPGAGRTEARSALREQLEGMVRGPVPGESGRDDPGAADAAALRPRWSAQVDPRGEEELTAPTPARVVELALRVDEPGPGLEAALEACVATGDVAGILDLAEGAPAHSRTAVQVEAYLFSPACLLTLLSGDDVDEGSMRRIVDALGDEAISPLFEKLASSESRAVRRKIFDRLVALGPRISSRIVQYLGSDAWYVQRNMLALLQRLPVLPTGFSPLHYIRSVDVRVRREALPLAYRDPGTREEALRAALSDADERVVRAALLEVQKGVPESVVPVLVEHVLEADRLAHLRSLAARALGHTGGSVARDALLELCGTDRGLLSRRRRLGPSSPELVAAVHALARGWEQDPEVQWVLEAARSSPDSRVRAAVERPPEGGSEGAAGGAG